MNSKSLGQIAFEAYKEDLEGKTYDGKQIPNWEDLGERVKHGWEKSAEMISRGTIKGIVRFIEEYSGYTNKKEQENE